MTESLSEIRWMVKTGRRCRFTHSRASRPNGVGLADVPVMDGPDAMKNVH